MCLAIYKPAGAQLKEEYLRNGFSNHSDGAGLAWAADGVLNVKKGFFDVEELIKQFELIKDYPCLIHFRKATHGTIDETNCHPFLFNDNKLALIHNGILPIKCSIDGLSDTAHFVIQVLEPMIKRNKVPINDGALSYLITTSIGTDKIVIMDGEGKVYMFNEEKGKWDDGVWYSNTSYNWSYKPTPVTPYQYPSQSTPKYDSHTNWKKQWDDSMENDSSYLEFWKRNKDVKTDIGQIGNSRSGDTQVLPMLTEHVDESGNVTVIDVEEVTEETKTETIGAGQMVEYGWWDEEIEADIDLHQKNSGITREAAILRVFSDK